MVSYLHSLASFTSSHILVPTRGIISSFVSVIHVIVFMSSHSRLQNHVTTFTFTSSLSRHHIHVITFPSSHSRHHIHVITFTSSHSRHHITSSHSRRHIHVITFTSSHSRRHIHVITSHVQTRQWMRRRVCRNAGCIEHVCVFHLLSTFGPPVRR